MTSFIVTDQTKLNVISDATGIEIAAISQLIKDYTAGPFLLLYGLDTISVYSPYSIIYPANTDLKIILGWNDEITVKFGTVNLYDCGGHVIPLDNINRILSHSHEFAGDLSKWDVSRVRYMVRTFAHSSCNLSGIRNWDVRNVKSMEMMFAGYNGDKGSIDIKNWDVSPDCNTDEMFSHRYFMFGSGTMVGILAISLLYSWFGSLVYMNNSLDSRLGFLIMIIIAWALSIFLFLSCEEQMWKHLIKMNGEFNTHKYYSAGFFHQSCLRMYLHHNRR